MTSRNANLNPFFVLQRFDEHFYTIQSCRQKSYTSSRSGGTQITAKIKTRVTKGTACTMREKIVLCPCELSLHHSSQLGKRSCLRLGLASSRLVLETHTQAEEAYLPRSVNNLLFHHGTSLHSFANHTKLRKKTPSFTYTTLGHYLILYNSETTLTSSSLPYRSTVCTKARRSPIRTQGAINHSEPGHCAHTHTRALFGI